MKNPGATTMKFENTISCARSLDAADELRSFREKFYIPIMHGKNCVYFTGNSLGLQPRSTQEYILRELEDWANFGVEGHFHASNPWVAYHELFPAVLTQLTGAEEKELVVMNQLTVNLHLLMTSFYRPSRSRFRIICEAKAFPSDQYAFASQAKLHGFDPQEAIVEVAPEEGMTYIPTQKILDTIKKYGSETALVIFGGVNYYSGQVFDMETIARAAHEAGAFCGFDLAHAIGNVPLELHNWNADFACWCSYKYLNSGPGGVAGAFIHSRHTADPGIPRLAGWWGHDKENRFKMEKEFIPIPTAEGWQLSNAPVLSMAAHKAALDIFQEAGFDRLRKKALQLGDYLLFIIDDINSGFAEPAIEIITPRNPSERGCQLSLVMKRSGREVYESLKKQGVIADWREPDVIRIAPVPLYNSFEDVFRFGEIVTAVLS